MSAGGLEHTFECDFPNSGKSCTQDSGLMPVYVKPVLPHRDARAGNPLSWMAWFRLWLAIAMRGTARCPVASAIWSPGRPGLRRDVAESGLAGDPRSRVQSPGRPSGPTSTPMEPTWTPMASVCRPAPPMA